MNFEVSEKRARVAARAFLSARADAGRGCALSPLEPRDWSAGGAAGRVRGGGAGRGSRSARVVGESYTPGARAGSRPRSPVGDSSFSF